MLIMMVFPNDLKQKIHTVMCMFRASAVTRSNTLKKQLKVGPYYIKGDPFVQFPSPSHFFGCMRPCFPTQLSRGPIGFVPPVLPLGFTAEKQPWSAGRWELGLNSL